MRILIKLYIVIVVSLSFGSCAKPVAPSGGQPDKKPPKILEATSEPNYQTNFNKKSFEIEFNEFIKVQNAIKEIVVSPPTVFIPKFEARLNKLKIKFDEKEVFKENATYQINFGDAIRDLNEGNILKNYSFVFATGDIIDSLEITGSVIDQITGKPIKDMIVMIYEDLQDSIVYLEKPLYFTKTDSKGVFKISNVRSDTFKIFGLEDSNLNYIYDGNNEKIAYSDSLIYLTDSSNYNIALEAFYEKTAQQIFSVDGKTPKIIKCSLKNPNEIISFELSNDTIKYESCLIQDSLFIYYDYIPSDPFYLISEIDSFKISPRPKRKSKLDLLTNINNNKLHPNENIILDYNQCLTNLIDTLISITDTLDQQIDCKQFIDSLGRLVITSDLKDTTDYTLTILPNAVTSFIQQNKDTITMTFKTGTLDDYGTIILVCDSLDNRYQYIYKLSKNNKVIKTKKSMFLSLDSLNFINLVPGDYSLEIIEDKDFDSTWTPGNYLQKSKAERQTSKKLEKLRKGWDQAVKFDLESFEKK